MTMFNQDQILGIQPISSPTPRFDGGLGGPNDLFLDFLEQNPRMAFSAIAPTSTGSPASQRFFQNSFQRIHDQFLGNLGQQILGGQTPTGRFSDFLQGFDFNNFAASQSPFMRGVQNQRFAPSTRFLFF